MTRNVWLISWARKVLTCFVSLETLRLRIMNDLGFFNSMKAYMRGKGREITKPTGKNCSLIQSEMWGLVKQFVDEFEPSKLFNIAVQKHAAVH